MASIHVLPSTAADSRTVQEPPATPPASPPALRDGPRVLLITPPFTQLNTPYPATANLTAFLSRLGYPVYQADLSIETALALFSKSGLERLFAAIRARPDHANDSRPEVLRALAQEGRYLGTVDAVIRFLQGRDPTLATRICLGDLLPDGPRFDSASARDEESTSWAFGSLGTADRARWLSSLYLDDLADLARLTVAPRFGLSRYGERLAASAATFDPLRDALAEPPGLVDELIEESLLPHLEAARPDLVGLSVPFPGNLYGALRIAQVVRRRFPSVRIALGGGYVNTELRQLSDPRVFDFVDYLTFDDGERPLLCLLEHLLGRRAATALRRTMLRNDHGDVVLVDGATDEDVPQSELPPPTYRGLPLDRYLSVIELLNPMHRLWSEGRWNKLTVAHGCYWKKCTFCDLSLDYIRRYEPTGAAALVDRIDALVAETGDSGFHFVDEAAPPLALVDLALELLARGRTVTWWGNIRFEKTFTPDVCRLLAASGCIAVTGGLEVASDRLLALIDKGVTVAQAARVTRAFADAGILVHAYLMYGFPTETEAETIESLELVRQLFVAGAIQSAFWHRFALTRHSPIHADPAAFKIKIPSSRVHAFANNDVPHIDPTGADPDRYAEGLRRAIWNYMQGRGLDEDVRVFFTDDDRQAQTQGEGKNEPRRKKKRLPAPPCPPDYVEKAIADRSGGPQSLLARPDARVVWLGAPLRIAERSMSAKRADSVTAIAVGRSAGRSLQLSPPVFDWLATLLDDATPRARSAAPRLQTLAASFPGGSSGPESSGNPSPFARFTDGEAWTTLRELGLLLLP